MYSVTLCSEAFFPIENNISENESFLKNASYLSGILGE